MQAVILAAGRGARLHPLTTRRSKAMLPIAGKPLVARVIEMLAAGGITQFILVAHPEDAELARCFAGEQSAGRVQIVHQPERLGTADALQRAARLIHGDFCLTACDNLAPTQHIADLQAGWQTMPRPNAALSLMPVSADKASSTGVVELRGAWVQRIIEKPAPGAAPSDPVIGRPVASLPLYIFSPDLLEYLPHVQPSVRGEREIQDAIQMLIEKQGNVRGVFTHQRRTVTSAADLLALNLHYLAMLGAEVTLHSPLPADTRLLPPVIIESDVQTGPGCTIGPNVFIESGCVIGPGAQICNSVLLRGAKTPPGAKIESLVYC